MKIYDMWNNEIDSKTYSYKVVSPEDGRTMEAEFVDALNSDECFDSQGFFQYAEIDGKLYRLYYEEAETEELDCIDYTRPSWMAEEKAYTLDPKDE